MIIFDKNAKVFSSLVDGLPRLPLNASNLPICRKPAQPAHPVQKLPAAGLPTVFLLCTATLAYSRFAASLTGSNTMIFVRSCLKRKIAI